MSVMFIFSMLMQSCRSTFLFLKLRKLEYWCVINACKILLSSEFIEVTSWVIRALSPLCLSTVSSPFLSCSFIHLCFLLCVVTHQVLSSASAFNSLLRDVIWQIFEIEEKDPKLEVLSARVLCMGYAFPLNLLWSSFWRPHPKLRLACVRHCTKVEKKCSPWFSEAQ